jgi:hypothetical protein
LLYEAQGLDRKADHLVYERYALVYEPRHAMERLRMWIERLTI